MPTPQTIAPYALAVAAVVLVWRVGVRLRRAVGRQQLKLWRVRLSAYLLPVGMLLLLSTAWVRPWNALAQGLGVGIGLLAARYSLRRTRFEVTEHGHFYTPDPYIGVAIVALFLARVAYRLMRTYEATGGFMVPPSEAVKNPVTVLVAGVVLGYYSWTAWGLLAWHKRTQR